MMATTVVPPSLPAFFVSGESLLIHFAEVANQYADAISPELKAVLLKEIEAGASVVCPALNPVMAELHIVFTGLPLLLEMAQALAAIKAVPIQPA